MLQIVFNHFDCWLLINGSIWINNFFKDNTFNLDRIKLSEIVVQPATVNSTSTVNENDTVSKEFRPVSENKKICDIYDIGKLYRNKYQ